MPTFEIRRSVLMPGVVLVLAAGATLNGLAQSGAESPAESEAKLRQWLLRVPEITLEDPLDRQVEPTLMAEAKRDWEAQKRYHAANEKLSRHLSGDSPVVPPLIPSALSKRWEALGLEPITLASNRQAAPNAAKALQAVAASLRSAGLVTMPGPDRTLRQPVSVRDDAEFARRLDSVLYEALVDEATVKSDRPVAGLSQMLCVEEETIRLSLIRTLAERAGARSSAALARLAVYDLSPAVRKAAVAALRKRPSGEFQRILLDGFRHPWPVVAGHAAEAVSAVGDRSAKTELQKLLDGPDPTFVRDAAGRPMVGDLVRVNHLKNETSR